jgi:uncharacterized caspase-like protein
LRYRVAYLFVVLLLIIIPSVFAQSPQRGVSIAPNLSNTGTWGVYHALIIGINDYKEWPRLQTAVKDATVIRDTLVSRYGFDKKNVILRTDRKASRHQITRDLRYLAKSMRKNDNLFVYYAGHGQLDDFTGDGYWVPAEGALKNPSTWVANSYIKAILSSEKLQAKNVVVIADSCYSGSMLRGGPSLMTLDDQRYQEKLAKKASLRSRQVISSGGVEPVADGGAEGHSLFAFYLIDALRKNDREVIDLENLFHTRVWKPVTEIGDQRPNVGRLKTPMDQDGQFVLYNAAWVKEQAQNQAALEAKKQEQARQQTAVASAELELQRQRFEMEKQKLAYEKEQLSQQKTLELERLKFERQKQEFEYAKLQAQLEAMKQDRKGNEKPEIAHNDKPTRIHTEKLQQTKNQQMIASISPVVKNQSGLTIRRSVENSYRLAIFPLNFYTTGHDESYLRAYQLASMEGIASVASEDDRLTLTYSCRELEGATEGVILLKDVLKKNVWKKKSIFSKSKPDWDEVKKLALKIDADLIVMIDGQISPGSYTYYLYDSEISKIYSKNFRTSYLAYPNSVKSHVRSLMRDFFKNQ